MRNTPYSHLIYTLAAFTILFSFAPVSIAQRRGDFNREVHETYPFEGDGRISLENINGDVNITAWDRDEVKIDVYISAYSQERLDDVDIDIDVRRDRLYIETRYPDRWSNGRNNRDRYDRPARVDYTVSVPRSVTLDEIKLINGDLDLKGVEGEIHTSSINGRIRADNMVGEVRISTVNGDMDLSILHINRTNPVEVTSVNLSKTLREVQSLVMDIVGTTLDTIDIDDIEFDHRREMLRGQREIQRDVQEGIREAQREIQRSMREVQREMRDWEREKDW